MAVGTCLIIPQDSEFLADKVTTGGTWTNRFTYPSSSSDRKYVINQHLEKGFWACPCKGWIYHNNECKHLRELGLPGGKKEFRVDAVVYPASVGRIVPISASLSGKQLVDFGDTSMIRKIDLDDDVI